MVTDPISDMITRVRNASLARKNQVTVPFSKVKLALANTLKEAGYIKKVSKYTKFNREYICLEVAYTDKGRPAISEITRVSKPSRRVYRRSGDIHQVRQGRGVAIISTPQGLLTDKEARKSGLGGEVLCRLW